MPYTGKPSRGCSTCRKRKVKCDEGKPTCENCERGNRVCGGYRPEYELVHRDETVNTMLRVQYIKNRPPRRRPRPLPQAGDQCELVHSGRPAPLPVPLLEPLEVLAERYFAANFILEPCGSGGGGGGGWVGGGGRDGGSGRTTGGHLDFLMPMLRSQPQGSPLQKAFEACALGAFGNRRTALHVRVRDLAHQRYTSALSSMFVAVGRDGSHSDELLAAVLLLSQYENLTASHTQEVVNFQGWRAHVEGAVNLVKKRGQSQLESPTGLLLFRAVRAQLIPYLFSSDLSEVVGMEWWMSRHNGGSLTDWAQLFAFRAAELRLEVVRAAAGGHYKTAEGIEYLEQLSRRTQELDWEIANWLRDVPESLRPRPLVWLGEGEVEEQRALCRAKAASSSSAGTEPDPTGWHGVEAFRGRVDVYPDYMVAHAWNVIRSTRLMLCSMRLRCVARICWPLDYRERGEFTTIRNASQAIIAEIISSIPYQLGWRGRGRGNSPRATPPLTTATATVAATQKAPPTTASTADLGRASWDAGQVQPGNGDEDGGSNDHDINPKGYAPTTSFPCGHGEQELEERGIMQLKVAPAQFTMWSLVAAQNFDETAEDQREWCRGRLLYIADQLGIKAARGLSKIPYRFPSFIIKQYRDSEAEPGGVKIGLGPAPRGTSGIRFAVREGPPSGMVGVVRLMQEADG